MKLSVFIFNEHVGFLTSICKVLLKKQDNFVTLIVISDGVRDFLNDELIDFNNYKIVKIFFNQYCKPHGSIIEDAKKLEEKYKIKISQLISEERGMGQGYFVNVQGIPTIKRSLWTKKEKISSIIKTMREFEEIVSYNDIFLAQHPFRIFTSILKENNKPFYILTSSRYGSRYIWGDNEYYTSSKIIESIRKYYLNKTNSSNSNVKYEPHFFGKKTLESKSYKMLEFQKLIFQGLMRGIKLSLKSNKNNAGYSPFGWLLPEIKSKYLYNIIKNKSVSPSHVSEKFIYYPLHLEPEVSLFLISPEFTNVLESIIWLSKSIPCDMSIIVKEHKLAYGVRSKKFYESISKIPNILIADPDSDSEEWIKKSHFVSTITGSAGYEAVYFQKPVISFGKNQVINDLKTVFYASNFDQTKRSVDHILNKSLSKEILLESMHNLYNAQIEHSFECKTLSENKNNRKINIEAAEKALSFLTKSYPEVTSEIY